MAMVLRVGDQIPLFKLSDQDGNQVHIQDFFERGPLVIYFYPKDDTPGCTAQACSFRDAYQDFSEAGAEVIGISSDSISSHKKFSTQYRLPFLLLSDENGRIRKKFGVPKSMGFMTGRVTYVVSKDGTVRHMFESQVQIKKHVKEALRVIEKIKREDYSS
jgi:peroxiredoxin Q/BCP